MTTAEAMEEKLGPTERCRAEKSKLNWKTDMVMSLGVADFFFLSLRFPRKKEHAH